MPVTRMRMRPWLEAKIESEAISGLKWVDQEKQMFSIPWKHAARHGWEVDRDACLFKQWAIHTGKFKQGETEPDPKTWKANFRCAMNSLPDIEEVKDRSVNRGSSAVRVYRMLQVTSKPTDKRCKRDPKRRSRSSKVKEEVSDSGDSCSGEQRSGSQLFEGRGAQESRVDSSDGLCEPTYTETEVPDFVTSVDVVCADPDSTSQHYAFQVSPEHSPAYGDMDMDTEAIIEITQQLEQDHTQWLQGKGFPTNEVCSAESYPSAFPTTEVCSAESYPSPASQWSESSGEELELRLYTELSSGLPSTDEMLCYTDYWSHSNTNFLQQISCPY